MADDAGNGTPTEILTPSASLTDPQLRLLAAGIASELVSKLGSAAAVVVLNVGLSNLLVAILHAPTPMPEANIATIQQLLAQLAEDVLSHVPCALELNNAVTHGTIH